MASEADGTRLPPQNLDAERSVLGSMLRNNLVIDEVVQIVKADNFYSDAHRKIFDAIVQLHNDNRHLDPPSTPDPDGKDAKRPKARLRVDLVTLAEQLVQNKHIGDIGGYGKLAELWDAAPSAANAAYYARIVRDKGMVRDLINTSTEILHDAYEQNMPAQDMLEQAEQKIFQIAQLGVTSQTVSLFDALMEVYKRIDAQNATGDHGSISGLATGFTDLDNITAGLQNSELVIVAARPSVGKTAFGLGLVRYIAIEENRPVFFVSLEQSRLELASRLLCSQARVDSQKLRKGYLSSEDMDKLQKAGDVLSRAKVYIDDSPAQGMLRIAANARRLLMQHEIQLVVVDYLQLIEPDNRRESRQEQVANISRRLKHLARELKIPVVALAQVNRGSEDRQDHRPRLSDLRESGSIEQDADTVMLLHRPGLYETGEAEPGHVSKEGVIEVIVAKQRNGPTDTVTLTFVKQYMRFENFAIEQPFGYNAP